MSGRNGAGDQSEVADAVFTVLLDEHRRCALYYLRERGSVTIEELATVVTGWVQVREDAFSVATPDDRERVRAALHHVHLPRIDEEGFVRYDRDSGQVTLAAVPPMLESVLDCSLERDRREAGRRPDGGVENESGGGVENETTGGSTNRRDDETDRGDDETDRGDDETDRDRREDR